jgi:hypothetical protein
LKAISAVVATLSFAFYTNVALAVTWAEVAKSKSSVVYVDTDSIVRTGQEIKVWVRYVNSQPVEVEGTFPKRFALSAKLSWQFNCAKRTAALFKSVEYADPIGEDIIVSNSAHGEFTDVVPGSTNEIILNKLCTVAQPSK